MLYRMLERRMEAYHEAIRVLQTWGDIGATKALVVLEWGLKS